ncbi:MAG: signal peptidase II [Leptotrichiaceae bacterium]
MYLIILILVLTAIDQLSKLYMYNMSGGEIGYSIPIINDFFHLTYIENHGGIFGVFQGKINYFTIISIVLIAYVVITEIKNFKKYKFPIKLGISIITAGALGNMIDRIFRGFVIDMIDFRGIWGFIFNIADTYIHIGLYIILFTLIRDEYKKMKKNKKE